MKSLMKFFAVLMVMSSGAWITPQVASAQQGSVSFQVFYDELSPYGTWVDYPNYGYVWIPNVDRDFSPYGTNGHWIFTDDGWTWVSDYPWGWAPFHYGRWAYDDSYGWLWVPHHEWGPAWVTWRRSEGYYGWAPMEPGISIEVSFGGRHRVPNDRWMFVRDRDFGRSDIDHRYVDRSTNVTIINNSTVINNTYIDNSRHTTYVAGPPKDDVQKVTGSAIRPVAIRENDKPGQTLSNDQLRIYRPRMDAGNANDHKPMPTKLVSLKEVKPVSERTPGTQRDNVNLPSNKNEQSAPQQKANPPATKPAAEQPRVINAPEKTIRVERPTQPQDARPFDKNQRVQQPPAVNTPDKTKSLAQPSQTQDARPFVKKGRGQQPPVVNTPGKSNRNVQSSPRQDARPSARKATDQKPRAVNPSNKGQPSQPRKVAPNVAPFRENRQAEPAPAKTNKDEEDKGKR